MVIFDMLESKGSIHFFYIFRSDQLLYEIMETGPANFGKANLSVLQKILQMHEKM